MKVPYSGEEKPWYSRQGTSKRIMAFFCCVNYIIYIFSMLMTQFRHALPAHHYLSASSTLLLCDIKYTFVECISDLGAAHFVPSSYIIISMPLFHLVSFSLFRSIADVL